MRIAICDSNAEDQRIYLTVFKQLAEIHKKDTEFILYSKIKEIFFHYEDKAVIDILFLEVRLNMTSGIAAAQKLRSQGFTGEIIFLTNEKDLKSVLSGYDVDAMHYIIKGETSMTKIEEIFLRAKERSEQKQQQMIMFTSRNEWINIPIDSIRFFEIYKKLVKVYYANESFEFFCDSFLSIKEQLSGARFIQSHRSYLVAIKEIQRLTFSALITRDGREVPVGRAFYPLVKEAMMSLE